MRHITINWLRLFRYSLLFLVFASVFTVFLIFWFSQGIIDGEHNLLAITLSEFEISMELAITLFIYVCFPILLFRFLFFFAKMIYRGRKPDVPLITYKTLFNPVNFLLFPSLLSQQGLLYRRRCLLALIMLVSIYAIILMIT